MKDWYQKPVAEGVWLYDDTIENPMYIIEQNYDYFHSMYEADGMLQEGEKPKLNAQRLVYYLYFGELPPKGPYGVSEQGAFMSVEEAKSWAEKNLPYFSRWLEHT